MISSYLVPLTQFGKTGLVHSVFSRSLNIRIGQQLVNITNYPDYFSSYGMYLEDLPFDELMPYVQQGNLVKVKEQSLVFYSMKGVYTVELADMDIINLNIHSLKLDTSHLIQLKNRLEPCVRIEKIGLPLDDQARHVLQEMENSGNGREVDWDNIIRFLIGRGHGLTPSGDDILVAFLIMLQAMEDERVGVVTSTLLRTRCSTTDISQAYIEASMEGYMNSRVYTLLSSLKDNKGQLQKEIEGLLQIGHFSGRDLAYGMLLALQKMSEKEEG